MRLNPPLEGATRVVRCPGCAAATPFSPQNPWRPFCSQRCRDGDLGAWANESYRVASAAHEDDEASPPGS